MSLQYWYNVYFSPVKLKILGRSLSSTTTVLLIYGVSLSLNLIDERLRLSSMLIKIWLDPNLCPILSFRENTPIHVDMKILSFYCF